MFLTKKILNCNSKNYLKMKKLLLIAATIGIAASSNAQRMSIYEEFSGENCGPCAASNPALWTLMSANTSKVILVKYQSLSLIHI